MLKRLSLVCLLSICYQLSFGQRGDCNLSLEQARSNFQLGHLFTIPSILKPCLDNGFNKVQKIEAYLILTRTYLLIDDPISAEDSYLKLLGEDPEYEVDEENDPVDIVYLDKKFTTTPIFILFAKGGLNFSNASTIVNYGVDNTNLSNEEYTSKLGFNLGGGIELNINDNLSVGLELNYFNRRYEYKNYLFNGDTQTFLERQSLIDMPLFLKYRRKYNKFHPYVYAGYSMAFLLNASSEVELTDLIVTGENNNSEIGVTGPPESLSDLRNRLNTFIVGGVGTKYRIGYNYLFFDVRYYYGLNNIVNEANQYSSSSLLYKYGFVDDYKRMTSLSFSLGYIWPLYKPRKIDRSKGLFGRIFDK